MKSIHNASLRNARVIMRVGFDVPAGAKGEVLDAFRIERTMPSIRYILSHGASLILIAHRGEPGKSRAPKFGMKPVANTLSKMLRKPVGFIPSVAALHECSQGMKPGKLALLENLRFEPGEEAADMKFAKALASAATLYVNDDFSTSHRRHASIVLLPKLLPHYAGLNLQSEIEVMEGLTSHPTHPFVIVIGGAKVSDKLGVATKLLNKADAILLGGVAATTMLAKQGVAVGRSRIDREIPQKTLNALGRSSKIILPIDALLANTPKSRTPRAVDIHSIPKDAGVYDIGPKTAAMYAFLLAQAHTIFWAGALGYTENAAFRRSTAVLAKAIKRRKGVVSIAGGGDTITALHATRTISRFSHISTGGGATLAYLAGERLPGIYALKQ